jgi:hypothetical protein
MVKKYLKLYVAVAVGVYVVQRFVTGPIAKIPGVIDPLGVVLGYPLTPK